MNIVRKYKLKQLGIPIDKETYKILETLSDFFYLEEKKIIEFPSSIFYLKRGKIVFKITSTYLYIRKSIYEELLQKLKLENDEIEEIFLDLVNNVYFKPIIRCSSINLSCMYCDDVENRISDYFK